MKSTLKKVLNAPDKEITLQLRVSLTETEIKDQSRKLADKARELGRLEEDKKRAGSSIGAQIKAARADMDHLSELVTTGYEIREVECRVFYHTPRPKHKCIVRNDTGEIVSEEIMSFDEMQLNLPIDGEQVAGGEPV